MRLVIQRVKEASVTVAGRVVGKIGLGMLVFLGVGKDDSSTDVDQLIRKIIELRIFDDVQGKMNLAISDAKGEFLVVSQFTLLGDCRKGRRPSFDAAADPKIAETLYNEFVEKLRGQNFKTETGEFRAMMDVSLINDGPVTFVLESKN
jgi:D-tyrosyl-tRNA(Tyr) deacylase